MKKNIVFVLTILPFFSCLSQGIAFEKIEFKNPYKFSSEIEQTVKTDTLPWKYQISATEYALKGDYRNALLHWEMAVGKSERNFTAVEMDSIKQTYKTVSAKKYILEQSKQHQIIIINEAHTNSFNRVYTKSLLQELYNNGYKYLGLEALGSDSLLNERKYPIQKTGYYTKSPQFGNLVRDALAIGFHLFAYEDTEGNNGKLREIGQAKNIQKVIEENPNEKFLIHCGHAHVLEGNMDSWEKAMAGRLFEYTGINPFTINQTYLAERSQAEYNNLFLHTFKPKESVVLLDKNEQPYTYVRGESATDIALLHPITEYIDDRPNWLFDGINQNVSIELKDMELSYPIMILAYKKGENIKEAVPVDIYEMKDNSRAPHLALPKGNYDVVVASFGNDALKFELEVK